MVLAGFLLQEIDSLEGLLFASTSMEGVFGMLPSLLQCGYVSCFGELLNAVAMPFGRHQEGCWFITYPFVTTRLSLTRSLFAMYSLLPPACRIYVVRPSVFKNVQRPQT